jgi:putative intracellular protease/amidase
MSRSERGGGLFAFVVYPGFAPLDLVGPMTSLTRLTGARSKEVVGSRVEPVVSNASLRALPDRTFTDAAAPYGLVIPGGGYGTLTALGDQDLLAYLKRAAASAEVVLAVGAGSLLLAAVNLLRGLEATTAPGYGALLERLGAHYVRENRVQDGKYLTAAGASSGIEAGILLADRFGGRYRARFTELMMEYDPSPPSGDIDVHAVDVRPPVLRPEQLQELRAALATVPAVWREVEAWLAPLVAA